MGEVTGPMRGCKINAVARPIHCHSSRNSLLGEKALEFSRCFNGLLKSNILFIRLDNLVRATSEVDPARVSTEWGAVGGSVAGHYSTCDLNIHRHHYMIIFSPGMHAYPALVS
jgi:hypothetical protein